MPPDYGTPEPGLCPGEGLVSHPEGVERSSPHRRQRSTMPPDYGTPEPGLCPGEGLEPVT